MGHSRTIIDGQWFSVFSFDYGRHEPGSNKNSFGIAGGPDIRDSATGGESCP